MTIVFESERLMLRLFSNDDAAIVFDLNKDSEVTKYTHDPINGLEQARLVLEKNILPQYALNSFGRWAVHLKADKSFIGWCGLKYRPELNEIDLGYRFKKEFWGMGYATEAAFASIKYGFETLQLPRITGRAEPDNIASIKVLEKCGMRFIGQQIADGHTAMTYELINPSVS